MWILIRLALATIGFAIRQLRVRRVPALHGAFEGAGYFQRVRRTQRGVTGFTIGMPRTSPTWIRLHAESAVDRLCKRLGIANELQTGDARFDDAVYVTCDHPHVHTVLRDAGPLRDAILAAFDAGYTWIRFDGSTVRMQRDAIDEPGDADLRVLKDIWSAAAVFEHEPPTRLADRFLWKALIVEGAIWAIAGYAIGAFIESRAHREDYHLREGEVIALGLVVAAAVLVLLLGAIGLWMRGSSRGHRVIVESAIVLTASLPITSIQLVGDTNRALDDGASIVATDTLARCERRRHRRKRGYYYTYHLHLVGAAERQGVSIPREIEVPSEPCGTSGATVHFEIGPGRWGIPWYREIRVDDATWSNRPR